MKKIFLTLISFAALAFAAEAQNVTIPDANFKAYLLAKVKINTTLDNEISIAEAAAFTGEINLNDLEIESVTGLEAFTSLTSFSCNYTLLSSLDVSANTALISLFAVGIQLNSLNVSNNTALTMLNCSSSNVTSITFGQNSALTILICSQNQLTSLDVSTLTALDYLDCNSNLLTSLNLKNNTNLTTLYSGNNPITSLNLTKNTGLTFLDCNNSDLKSIDVSTITNLHQANFYSNFNLTCIGALDSQNKNGWEKEDVATYSEGCRYVTFPDAIFKYEMVGGLLINPNQDDELTFDEAKDFTGEIHVINYAISSIVGIEAFENITVLDCESNQLTTIDISKNLELTDLRCQDNQLTSLDISKNINLVNLFTQNNKITSLDFSNNASLQNIVCYNNLLSSLDVSNITALDNFVCFENPDLTCIKSLNSQDKTNWTNDPSINYSEDCSSIIITATDNTVNKQNKTIGAIYNSQGQLVANNYQGFVIIKYTDGSSLKVIQ
jgi:Leucine-rich repeat (LRR) protein